MQVKVVMSKAVFCCTPKDSAQHAANLMKQHNVGAIPVVNDCTVRGLVGIITDRDLSNKVVAEGRSAKELRVGDLMTKSPTTCSPADTLEKCERLMSVQQVRRVPVVDAKGICLGMIAQADIALHDTANHISKTLAAISKPSKSPQRPHISAA
jgi:CBS domain-containing protein